MQSTAKKIVFSLLLFSHMLTSCNPFKIAHRNSVGQAQRLNICTDEDNPDNDIGSTPLMIAARNNHLEVVEYLVKNGAKVNQAKENGSTPLYIAAQEGHLEVVEYLVGQGAKVDQVVQDNWTPLHIAAENGFQEVVEYLVKNGAKVDQAKENGSTPRNRARQ